jgi:hypothetical protein
MKKAFKRGCLALFIGLAVLALCVLFLIFTKPGQALTYEVIIWSRNTKLRPWALRNLEQLGLRGLEC